MSDVWGERVDYRPSMHIRWSGAAVVLAAVALIGTVPACSSSGSEESVPSAIGEGPADETIPDVYLKEVWERNGRRDDRDHPTR